MQSVTVSTAASYQSTLNSQQGSANPLLLVIDTAISGTRGGSAYSYDAGDVVYGENKDILVAGSNVTRDNRHCADDHDQLVWWWWDG